MLPAWPLRRALHVPRRSLPLCCLRLLFFPLVIAWDTYAGACRNLQGKYEEWQLGNLQQVGACSALQCLDDPVCRG